MQLTLTSSGKGYDTQFVCLLVLTGSVCVCVCLLGVVEQTVSAYCTLHQVNVCFVTDNIVV